METLNKEVSTIEQIKKSYPDEWILLGNPDMDEQSQEILAGVVLYHSFDEHEVIYLGKPLAVEYKTASLFFNSSNNDRVTAEFFCTNDIEEQNIINAQVRKRMEAERRYLTVAEAKELYPDEWILLGNPEKDEYDQTTAGVLLYHSTDKREIAYYGKPLAVGYKKLMWFFNRVTPRKTKSVLLNIFSKIQIGVAHG